MPTLVALVVGFALIGRVGVAAVRALPPSERGAYRAAWRTTTRPISTAGVFGLWTLVYALYSLSLPMQGPIREIRVAGPTAAPTTATGPSAAPVVAPLSRSFPSFGVTVGPVASAPPTSATTFAALPAPRPAPAAAACSLAGVGRSVADVQAAAEQLTGHPLGADLSLVVEALAGCGNAENAALSLLGPVNQLLNEAGVPVVPLPQTPEQPLPKVPEPIAAPLRPTVFRLCGQITPQLLTVAAVAPVARISTQDALRVLRYVSAVCSSFAPEGS